MSASVGLWCALGCALLAVIYGIVASMKILALPDGNDRMKAIAGAVQEGAKAYLNRQYITIGLVGAVLFVLIAVLLDLKTALGFGVGAVFSGIAGYVGMNVSVRANVRTAEAARSGLPQALSVAFQGGAITGMLVVGLGLLGVAGYYYYLSSSADATAVTSDIVKPLVASALAVPSFPSSPVLAAASSPKALTWAPTSWAKSKPAFLKTTPATPPLSPTTWATTWATARAWPPTFLKPMP